MSDIMYNPEHIRNANAELDRIYRRYKQIADRFEGLLGGCPGEIASSGRVRSAYSRGCADTETVKARFNALSAALEGIEHIYTQNDENIGEIVSAIKDFELPESWVNVPFMAEDIEKYIKDEYQYSAQETTAAFNIDIDIPQWMMEELAKEKFDL